jgi:hypothetical protein
VTLEPGVAATELLARIDRGPGCSIKDSFADLDLHEAGFEILFSAEWIHRPAGVAPSIGRSAPDSRAERPTDNLVRWRAGPDRDGIDGIVMLDGDAGNEVVAGAWLNLSTDVVGVSNVVALGIGTTLDDIWAGLLTTIDERFPGLPIVGYESGAELDAALRHGFTPIGPLRVWLKPG